MVSAVSAATGRYVDVGGRRLYLESQGEGSPIVVFENGLGVSLEGWAIIQPEVAHFTRTIAYDRAGIGRSDRSRGPVDAVTIARDLHAALQAAGEPGPYVLVGHSLGGVLIRLFAHLYPDDVAGLVFVDSSHPEQETRLPVPRVLRAVSDVVRVMPALARMRTPGLSYLMRRTMGPSDLPPEAVERSVAYATSPGHLSAVVSEYRALGQMFAQGRMTGDLGDRPIAIVSAGSPKGKLYDAVRGLHRELADLSTRSTVEIVAGAKHVTIVTNRTYALAVVDAIRRVVDAVRAPASA
jgi:pimeloyl-ACP methyl ester carboxylesterase